MVVAVFLGAALIATGAPAPPVVHATPFPNCVGDDDDNTDVDCLPPSDKFDVQAIVSGVFGPGTMTIVTSFFWQPCDWYQATTNCFWSVDRPRIEGCYYLKNGDPERLESCGSDYRSLYKESPSGSFDDHFEFTSGTATPVGGNPRQLRCQGSYSTVYAYGGDARTDFVWRERGPNTADCDIAVNLPVPDDLKGPSLVRVRVGGQVCNADSGTNCSSRRSVKAYAWLPVSGQAPPPDDDPNDNGGDDNGDNGGDDKNDTPPVDPADPKRITDTRPGEKTSDGLDEGEGLVEAGTVKRVEVAGRANVPDDARAVIVNAIAVGPDGNGFLTLYSCDQPRPNASSVNYQRGQVVANTAIVEVSGSGDICVYSLRDVHVVLDVTGFIRPDSTVVPLAPSRLVETREEEETVDGESEGIGRVEANSITKIDVVGRGGVEDGAVAIAATLAAVDAATAGNLRVYPCTEPRMPDVAESRDHPTSRDGPPLASNLNVGPGQTRANSAIVALGSDGGICVFNSMETDFILDVNAAFYDDEDFLPIEPLRVLETRRGESTFDGESEGAGKMSAGETRRVQLAGRSLPDDIDFAAVNITAVDPDGNGYITAYRCDVDRPDTSSVNFSAGAAATANSGMFALDDEGGLCLYAHEAVHVVMDGSAVVGPNAAAGP